LKYYDWTLLTKKHLFEILRRAPRGHPDLVKLKPQIDELREEPLIFEGVKGQNAVLIAKYESLIKK